MPVVFVVELARESRGLVSSVADHPGAVGQAGRQASVYRELAARVAANRVVNPVDRL